jgi:D-alanyl-D-alanine carboxypeptidase (penicillin-binding protein 5/6)
MTAFVVLRLMEKFNIDESTLITIGTDATTTIGTTAELQEGDTLTLWQLLYALLLPSGNDAAHQLAEYFGELIQKDNEEKEKKMKIELE